MSGEPDLHAATGDDCLTAGELLVAALRASWERFMEQDALVYRRAPYPGGAGTEDSWRVAAVAAGDGVRAASAGDVDHERVEAVHQARVALRRIRSNVRVANRLLDKAWAGAVAAETRWYAGRLGAVRDWDVLKARSQGAGSVVRSLAGPAELTTFEVGLGTVLRCLDREIASALDDLVAARADARFEKLRVLMSGDLERAPLAGPASARWADVMPRLISKQWRVLASRADQALGEQDERALHAVRVRVKRLRYAVDTMAPAGRGELRRFSRSAAALQDVLGEWHDSSVSQAWLLAISPKVPPAATFVAGKLSVVEAELSSASRARWPAAWSTLRRSGGKLFS